MGPVQGSETCRSSAVRKLTLVLLNSYQAQGERGWEGRLGSEATVEREGECSVCTLRARRSGHWPCAI